MDYSPRSDTDGPRDRELCPDCKLMESCDQRTQLAAPVIDCELFVESALSRDHVAAIVDRHAGKPGAMISTLEAIQAKFGYLPERALELVAARTGRPLTEIYGVATFYKAFSLTPRGEHLCSVCVGTACHVRGATTVQREVESRLGISAGETTADRRFTLETVNCLGACAMGPVVVMDGHYFPEVATKQVSEIIAKTEAGLDHVEVADDIRVFPVQVCCARCNRSLMDSEHAIEGYPAVRVTISFGRRHGWLRLSSLYGSYTIESEHEIPPDTVANFFCPFCHAELIGATDCPSCDAPMVPLIVRGGGIIQICSRRGCRSHMLDISGPSL